MRANVESSSAIGRRARGEVSRRQATVWYRFHSDRFREKRQKFSLKKIENGVIRPEKQQNSTAYSGPPLRVSSGHKNPRTRIGGEIKKLLWATKHTRRRLRRKTDVFRAVPGDRITRETTSQSARAKKHG